MGRAGSDRRKSGDFRYMWCRNGVVGRGVMNLGMRGFFL